MDLLRDDSGGHWLKIKKKNTFHRPRLLKLSTMQYLSPETLLTWLVPSNEGSNTRYFKYIYKIICGIYWFFLLLFFFFFYLFIFFSGFWIWKVAKYSEARWQFHLDYSSWHWMDWLSEWADLDVKGPSWDAIGYLVRRYSDWVQGFRAPWKSLWLIRSIRNEFSGSVTGSHSLWNDQLGFVTFNWASLWIV